MSLIPNIISTIVYGRLTKDGIDILKKNPELNKPHRVIEIYVRCFTIAFLIFLIAAPIFFYLLTQDITSAAIMTFFIAILVAMFGVGGVLIISLFTHDKNLEKITEEMSLGGKPKDYDPLLVKIEKYKLPASLLVGVFLYIVYPHIGFLRALMIPLGVGIMIDGIVAIVKKRDYFLDNYQGSWAEGKGAVIGGMTSCVIGLAFIIVSIYFYAELESLFGVS